MGDNTLTTDLKDASMEDLKNIIETPDAELEKKIEEQEVIPKVEKPDPKIPKVKKEKTYEIEIKDVEGIPPYKFENQEQLIQSFINEQKAFARLNGELGTVKQKLARMGDLEKSFAESQRQIEELKRASAQVAAGQQPTAVSKETIAAAEELGFSVDNLTPENFKDKMAEWQKAIKAQAVKEAKEIMQSEYEPRLKKIDELEGRLGNYEKSIKEEKESIEFDRNINKLFTDVEKIQDDKTTNGLLKTQWPIAKVNEYIEKYKEQAALMLPPGDYEKAMLIFGGYDNQGQVKPGLLHLYCGQDENGNIQIDKRQIPNIKAAFAAFAEMNNLQRADIATAHTGGQKSVIEQLEKVANRPPTLPNNLSTQDGLNSMTIEEAQALMEIDPRSLKPGTEKWKKWHEAQQFISEQI